MNHLDCRRDYTKFVIAPIHLRRPPPAKARHPRDILPLAPTTKRRYQSFLENSDGRGTRMRWSPVTNFFSATDMSVWSSLARRLRAGSALESAALRWTAATCALDRGVGCPHVHRHPERRQPHSRRHHPRACRKAGAAGAPADADLRRRQSHRASGGCRDGRPHTRQASRLCDQYRGRRRRPGRGSRRRACQSRRVHRL